MRATDDVKELKHFGKFYIKMSGFNRFGIKTKWKKQMLTLMVCTVLLAAMSGAVNAATGDVIKSFSAPAGTQPSGLAWDGSNLWMSSYMKEGGVYKLDPVDGSVLGKYTPPAAKYNGYGGLTYDGTYLWEADAYGSGIYKLSLLSCSTISTIPSPDRSPGDLAWDGRYLWLYGYPTRKIYKIRPADGSTVAVFDAPEGTGQNAGLTYDGTHLWSSGNSDIFKLAPSDCTEISSFHAPCARPESLAWDGKYLWCASFDEGMIYQIDIGHPTTPPNTPNKPSGISSGLDKTSYTYSTSATDPDNDRVKYTFDWGDETSTTTDYVDSGSSASASHSWTDQGDYIVKAKAVDSGGMESGWSEGRTVAITTPNIGPNTPDKPSGALSGQTGTSYTYRTSATDPDNDRVKYTFDWGDETSTTTDYVDSGSSASASHSWTDQGDYIIRVKAVDSGGLESEWSDGLAVTITTGATEFPSDPTRLDDEERETELVQIIGVILVIAGLLFTALTAVKKDVTIELGVSERTIKYVGGTGIVLIVVGVYVLLKSAGLI